MKKCRNECCDNQIPKRNYCDTCRKYKSRKGEYPTWEAVLNRRDTTRESWKDHEVLYDPAVMAQLF